ncbi:MAG: hypothetical protein WDN30_09775 [Pararobbsia sp.]
MTQERKITIACIGWGSLIWSRKDLAIRGEWNSDGPPLPVEFARESDDGRITLVICSNVPNVPTYWATLDVPAMQMAKEKLAAREFPKATEKWVKKNIGFWHRESGESYGMEAKAIAGWAAQRDLDGVVWTNLLCGLKGARGTMPSGAEVITRLRSLDSLAASKAEQYVRCAPPQVDTAYRRLIEKEFGWLPSSSEAG